MSYTDLRDFDQEYVQSAEIELRVNVQVEKMGGGTIGKKYDGYWRYIVTSASGKELRRGQDFYTSQPMTHEQAAARIAQCIQDEFNHDA